MKRKESRCGIGCYHKCGPIFGDDGFINEDICINDNCNREDSCIILNHDISGYECHPKYKRSLFVNTDKANEKNNFSVLDYEVYYIDNYKDYISNTCKYPNIIMEYIETNDISEESLKQVDDDTELLTDFNAIHCEDSAIRVKISCYCLKDSSKFLPNTQIVDKKYDKYLKKWAGDYKWKLIYRASDHGYTAQSFHIFCNNVKGPTLIVIKSSGGWIFGGYTTKSWSGWGIYDMI